MRALASGIGVLSLLLLSASANAGEPSRGPSEEALTLQAGAMPALGKVDERFQSFQVSFSHVTGGQTWRAYGSLPAKPPTAEQVAKDPSLLYERRAPVDLSNPRLRALTAALGPLYIRYGGTTANSVYFQDDDAPAVKPPAGFTVVLTRAAWKNAIDFAKAVNAKILTSFTISSGVRDAAGAWTPAEAAPWLAYTKAVGGEISAAELFNEPNFSSFGNGPKTYSADDFARDFHVYEAFARTAAPGMKLAGPGDSVTTVQAPGPTPEQLMTGTPRPHFDIVSYHFYPAIAARCAPPSSPMGISADRALSEEFLARADKVFQQRKALRDRYAPGAPIWLTETGAAACGGPPWQPTFLDSFRFADQQGRLAKQGLDVMFSHALIGKNYGLLDEGTFEPRPTYWTALLWRRLMGAQVLDAGASRPGLHLYAQCLPGARGGVTVLAINLAATPAAVGVSGPAQLYGLTAAELQSKSVMLNGRTLALGPGDRLPAISPRSVKDGRVVLAPASINFIALPRANNPHCSI
jgi:hypothetical protein